MRLWIALVLLWPAPTLAQSQHFQTTVTPKPDEDLAGDCHYELELTRPEKPVRAVWVTFERGRDMLNFYSDVDVQSFAQRFDIAMLLAHHCKAKGSDDMDMDPSKGIGRALFAALDQFAQATSHSELSTSALIVLGFSGAGSLTARMAGYAPDRLLAAVLANPGHSDPLGMNTVELPRQALSVPELILTGGADSVCGTQRPYEYFRKYRDLGAPWVYVVQNETPHCCVVNAKDLILSWLEAILLQRGLTNHSQSLRTIDEKSGWIAFITTRQTDTKDTWGANTWDVVSGHVERSTMKPLQGDVPAGWLPSRRVAEQWLSFIEQQHHPVTSLP